MKPKRERRTKILQANWDVLGEKLQNNLLGAKPKQMPSSAIYPEIMDVVVDDPWVYLVPGISDGTFLKSLVEKTSDMEMIVLLEKSPHMLRYALGRVDLSVAIMSNRIVLIDTDDPAQIAIRLQLCCDRFSRGVKIVKPVWNYDSGFWATASRFVLDYADAQKTMIVTQMTNSRITAENILGNAREYLKYPTIENLKGCIKDKSAAVVIVAAGPSIDDVLPLMPNIKNLPTTITCLTMLKPLLANGVRPAYVTALDYHEVSARFLEGVTTEDIQGITFLMDPKVNPAVIEAILKIKGSLCFFSENWLNELFLLRRQDYIAGCCTVAHLSFQVAAWLGARNIIMLGNDLSFPDDRYYAEAIYKYHPWKESMRIMSSPQYRMLRVSKNKDGDAVYTDEQMVSYLKQFELMWKTFDGVVVDCSHPKSVKKAYCKTMSLPDAVEKYHNDEMIEFPPLVPQNLDIIEMLRNIDKYLQDLDGFIKAHGKILNAYIMIDGKLEDEVVWNNCRVIILKQKEEIEKVMYLSPRIENFSGVAEFITRWEDTKCERKKKAWDEKQIKQHRFSRDLKHITSIQNSAKKMYEMITLMRDKIKNGTE